MRFKLETDHFLWDSLVEAGTEIGDGTQYPIPDGFAPSASMEPLDDEAKALSTRTGEGKLNWGRPEENLPVSPRAGNTNPVVGTSINRQAQPIIPPPLEHLTHPSDRKPHELGPRQNPLVEKALREQNERIAAENDARMAEEANRQADEKSKANLPKGVTVDNRGADARANAQPLPGQGPASKTPTQSGVPGQGPGPKPAPKPPAPPSEQVPRDQAGSVTPSSETGQHKDPKKE